MLCTSCLSIFSSLLAVERSRLIAKQADVIAAMSLEVLKGTTRAFDACKFSHHY